MARSPRIFQSIVTSTKTSKPMRASFASKSAALADIVSSAAFSRTDRGQAAWGDLTSAEILNKETGERWTIAL